MNDRGLSLSPTDMLKGLLLSNINDPTKRANVEDMWKQRIHELQESDKEAPGDCFKTWLRSQYDLPPKKAPLFLVILFIGVSAVEAGRANNPKVAGSDPAPTTKESIDSPFFLSSPVSRRGASGGKPTFRYLALKQLYG